MSSSKKKALGKGLDAILGPLRIGEGEKADSDVNKVSSEQILLLQPQNILPSKVQTRKTFNEESLQSLADSIKKHGLQEPIIVRKSGDKYELVCGERRLRACIIAGLNEIPALCRNISDDESILLGLIENIQREDLNPIEEAEAYQSILERFVWSQEQLAETIGKDRSSVSNSIRLLSLPSAVQMLVVDGKLSMGHARALLGLNSPQLIIEVANKIINHGLSVRQTEQLVMGLKSGERKKPLTPKKIKNPHIIEIEQELSRRLGTRVNIKHGNSGKGKIEVNYFSNNELTRILTILGISLE
ncbi:MAG: ParB/RepB/Spo0J family partition protein [Candidatus Hydrogenedens sp.]|nr:ParB/RepB/Spo0J family partition protein [Candidatus Hydrogenedens sp.]